MKNDDIIKPLIKQKKGDNLSEIMQLLLQQYHYFATRKERLENKAIGYLTPLAILMAATIPIMVMMFQDKEIGLFFLIPLFFFWGQVYFSIWTLCFSLKAYSIKNFWYPNIKEYADKNWQIDKAKFLGGINKSFVEVIDDLNKTLDKLANDVDYCRSFLTLSIIFGIINIVLFIMYMIKF